MSVMHTAARGNDLEEMQRLIVSGQHDINAQDDKKRTPLVLACWAGHADMVKLLLRNNAKLDVLANDKFTPLHFANNVEVIKLLLKKDKHLVKARVTKGNKTALHMAIPKGNIDVVTCLLSLGSDVMAKTGSNQSCLELAKSDEMYALIKAKYEEKIAQKEELNQRIKQKAAVAATKGESDMNMGENTEEEGEEMTMNQEFVVEDSMGALMSMTTMTSSSSSSIPTTTSTNVVVEGIEHPTMVTDTNHDAGMPSSLLGIRKADVMMSSTTNNVAAQQKRKMRMKSAAGSVGVKLSHLGDDEDD